jgi:hypothetical protein
LRSIDGISGNLLEVVFPEDEDTEWAAGYTDNGFRAVSVGMTRKKVYELLGKPLYTWENYGGAEIVEWWTRSPADTNFRQRAVAFQGDRVVEKVGEYWLD